MKSNTLLRNATSVEGGGAPSGTISLDNSDTTSADLDSTGDDSSDDITGGEAEAKEMDSPIEQKIPVNKGKAKVEAPIEDGSEVIGDLDEMEEGRIFKEEKVDDKAKEAEKAKAEAKADGDKKPAARDYSIFEPEVKAVVDKYASKLPNELFNTLKKYAEEKKALVSEKQAIEAKYNDASKGIVKLPDSYIEHPAAWQFNPQVKQIRENINLAQAQVQHYVEQVDKIEQGADWEDIVGLNEDGTFKTEVVAATDTTNAHKRAMEKIIRDKEDDLKTFMGQMGQLKTSHQNTYREIVTGIDTKLKEFCPWLVDVKQQELKFPIVNERGEIEERTIKQEMDLSLSRIPATLRNSPLAPVVVQLQVGLALSNAKLMAAQNGKVQTQQVKQDITAAEPKITSRGGGAKASRDDGKIPSLSDMDDEG